jgi:flagellar assembly factor FliW
VTNGTIVADRIIQNTTLPSRDAAIEPAQPVNDYSFDLNDPDAEQLSPGDDVQPRVPAVLVVPEDVRAMTVNLQAPLVVNPVSRRARERVG